MMTLLKKSFYSIGIFLISVVFLLLFLLHTTTGLHILFKIASVYVPGVQVKELNGTAWQQFTAKEVSYKTEESTVLIKQLKVNWELRELWHKQLPIHSVTAQEIDLKQGEYTAKFDNLSSNGLVKKSGMTINSLQFNYLEHQILSQMQINFDALNHLNAHIKLNSNTKNSKIFAGILDIEGNRNNLQWVGDFHGPMSISLQGQLHDLVTLKQNIKWQHIQWTKDENTLLSSPEGQLNLSGTLPHLTMNFNSKINRTPQELWQVDATIQGTIPWKWNFDLNVLPLSSSKQEGLHTNISAKGTLLSSTQGNLHLLVKPGHYELPKGSLLPSLEFQGGAVDISLTPQQLSGKGGLAIDEHKKLNLQFKLPQFDLNEGLVGSQKIQANASLLFDSLDFLKNLNSEIKNPQGRFTASLDAQGTWDKKIIQSNLALSQGSVELPSLGLKLNSMQWKAHAQGVSWDAEGSMSSNNKVLSLKGKGALDPHFSGDVVLTGTDFPLVNTKEYQVNVSPQMTLNISSTELKIGGLLLIPYARVHPQTFSNSVSLSEDVVFKTEKMSPTEPPFNSSMNLRVEMGNDVELTYKGLHASLTGAVNLNQIPKGPVNATGELTVKKGKYKAYGQKLKIKQGQLIFTGGRLDNPGINVRASKKIDTTTASSSGVNQPFDFNNDNLQNANVRGNITVGVEVSGRLIHPKISLFSNPSILTQADILSMLVLGKPAKDANKAGGQLLIAAISSMNLGNGTNGTQLLEQLKKTSGFDINVKTTSNYNLATNQTTDSTAVVVGKSLSKKIYVSYNVGLSQSDPNVLTLKYLLNKFYSIQISSSTTSNGIDILYTSHKKG